MWRCILLVVVFSCRWEQGRSDVCTGNICQCTTAAISCTDSGLLDELPVIENVTHRQMITTIWLENQNLSRLTSDSLAPYPNLERIGILNSGLQTVDDDVFSATPHIREIVLTDNDISRFSWRVIHGLKNLTSLDLVNNTITCDCQAHWLKELAFENPPVFNYPITCLKNGNRQWLMNTELLNCDKPYVTVQPSKLSLEYNTSAKIMCSADEGTTKWQTDNLLSTFTETLLPNGSSILQVNNASIYDNGYITCLAMNDVGLTFEKVRFIIAGPPIIIREPYSDPAISDHCIIYTFRGVPKPSVTWSRDSDVLQSELDEILDNKIYPDDSSAENVGDRVNPAVNGLYEGCLKLIVPGRPGQSGNYNLTVSNVYGTVQKTVFANFGNETFTTLINNTRAIYTDYHPIQVPWITHPTPTSSDLVPINDTYTVVSAVKPENADANLTIYFVPIPIVVCMAVVSVMCYRVTRRGSRDRPAIFQLFSLCRGDRKSRQQLHDRVQKQKMLPFGSQKMLRNPNYLKSGKWSNAVPVHIKRERISLMNALGEGAFGKVYLGMLQGEGDRRTDFDLVAIKTIKDMTGYEKMFEQEVELMGVLQHENIVTFLGISVSDEPHMMVFEYMENGDLNNYLRSHGPDALVLQVKAEDQDDSVLDQATLLDLSIQVAAGTKYLASQHFVHRDLATRNCLVGQNLVVKIGDFGMSRDIYNTDYYKINGHTMLPVRWMPPESILYRKFTVESDVWSLGVVLWEIFTYGRQPWCDLSNSEVVMNVQTGAILDRPDVCPESMYKIMLACWRRQPSERISMADIHQHLITLSEPEHVYLDMAGLC